jgi:lipase maturation factor 1
MGILFASAFYSLLFQIHGLIGERGILPARSYLDAIARAVPGAAHYWIAPTLLWASSGDRALTVVVSVGLLAALLLTLNVWPRLTVTVCTIAFLSCIAALQDFASYQSDGMLLQAGVASALLAPHGVRPGLGASSPPSRASIWLLRWEWFAIYFESGLVKLMSGDVQWRTLTAMDHYYEDSPLPAWPGWYVQQLPHAFHAGAVLLTFALELFGAWVIFAPRRARLLVAVGVTGFQASIIATANYAFLNYLVLALGVWLVDDHALRAAGRTVGRALPQVARHWAGRITSLVPVSWRRSTELLAAVGESVRAGWLSVVVLVVTMYVGVVDFVPYAVPPMLRTPARALAPLRVANAYGLYAVMTTAEYEIEFQGRRDDTTWVAYPFRYKPQDPAAAPGLYGLYQPRFDWNLWFASLGPWNDNPWVVTTQVQLLTNDPSVLRLFAGNPFANSPPTAVRTMLWRYWFTDFATRRRTGRWWNRELVGAYSGTVSRAPDGSLHYDPP